jgi:Adenosine specific kinase
MCPKGSTSSSASHTLLRQWRTFTRSSLGHPQASNSESPFPKPVGPALRDTKGTSFSLGCGHTFVAFLKDGFPINVLNAIKACHEVCHIICATANPLQIIVAEAEQGGGILGVIDGSRPKGIEKEEDKKARKELLRRFRYKL